MELNKYIFPLRKWWWLLAASTLIAVLFSSVSVLRQPTIYQSRTTLMIGTTITDPNPTSNELTLGQQLAAAYADLANREIVRNATKDTLKINRLPDYVARALPNTQLIEIVVNDTVPARAQIVANGLADQLMHLGPISAQPQDRGRQEFIHQRLNNLEIQIKETEDQIERLQEELANTFSAEQIKDKQEQITSLQSKLSSMENNYGLLLSNTQQGAVNTLTVIESAGLPSSPIGPMKGLTILLAAVVGFALAAAEAYLLEYLDDSLKSPDVVTRLFSTPIIGHVFEQADEKKEGDRLFDADDLGHPIAEAFRSLRTNIEISQAGRPLKTILVTSADIGDGKTSIAANLALSMAQRGKEVVLLDADLRKPNTHEMFELANDRGLVDLLSGRAVIGDVLQFKKDKNIAVLTAGNTPPNPAELLSSKNMEQLLIQLKETADVVIIDGPPFIVADAMILASRVDGVLMVVRPGHTRESLAKAAKEHIRVAGAHLIGVVLSRIPLRGADYYAGKSTLYTYYGSNYGDARETNARKNFSGSIFFMDLEKFRDRFLSYVDKVTHYTKRRSKAVSKLSPK